MGNVMLLVEPIVSSAHDGDPRLVRIIPMIRKRLERRPIMDGLTLHPHVDGLNGIA